MIIKPEILMEEARGLLCRKKSFFPKWIRKEPMPPKRIELIHLPFYRFEVLLAAEEKKQKATIALDGLLGSMLFFIRDNLNCEAETGHLICDFVLESSEAKEIALREYRWVLLEHGLRNRREKTIEHISEARTIFYPFWVGYFQKGKSYDFKALDGISGEVQGVKMRRIFLKAFRQMHANNEVQTTLKKRTNLFK